MDFIEDIIEKYKRKQALKKITRGLGKITEDETTIYCFVDEKKFKDKCDKGNIYGFNLTHQSIFLYGHIYELRKNIVYIFDGISFDKPLMFWISSPQDTHSYIKFRNCNFTERITIREAENVVFQNNRRKNYRMTLHAAGKDKVKNIEFLDDKLLSGFSNETYVDIGCDTLEIYNTEFHCDEPKIETKNLIMHGSRIYSDEKVEIDADKIKIEYSEIYSSYELKLNTKECNDFSSIKAHDITYNGLPLRKHNNSYEEIDKLVEARQSLVDTLATIKVAEETYQKEEVSRYRKEIKNSPLTRRLSR